jgi:hypothetical protein
VNEAYTLVYASSSFLSPLIGSYIYIEYGIQSTFDIVAVVNFSYAIFLFYFNCGAKVQREDK